jgi:pilus assembly protein CpaB
MNGKSIVMLLFALISGLGAMYGTTRLLKRDKTATSVEMQDVLVAARDLKVEELLKADAVKVVAMPKVAVPAGSFTSFQDVEDRWIQIKTLENEPILERKLALKGTPAGLVARIPSGMRAFALEVTESTGVSGFILPDHRVDVVQMRAAANSTNTTSPNAANRQDAETILQDVLVLASGQTFTRPEDRSILSRTVTLAVTPEQVDILVAARVQGPLSLSLRGVNDRGLVKRPPPPPLPPPAPKKPPEPVVATVIKPAPPPPPIPPPAPPKPAQRVVTIYRGGLQPPVRVAFDGPTTGGSRSDDDSDDEESWSSLGGRRLPPLKTFDAIGTFSNANPGLR